MSLERRPPPERLPTKVVFYLSHRRLVWVPRSLRVESKPESLTASPTQTRLRRSYSSSNGLFLSPLFRRVYLLRRTRFHPTPLSSRTRHTRSSNHNDASLRLSSLSISVVSFVLTSGVAVGFLTSCLPGPSTHHLIYVPHSLKTLGPVPSGIVHY